jgi:hypothetical protein
MTLKHLLAGALASLALAGAAQAAVLTSASGAGTVVTDYSSASLVSFDLDLHTLSGTTLNFVIEQSDLALPYLNFNALVRNLSGEGLSSFRLSLSGISYAAAGSVTATFGTLGEVAYSASEARIGFSSPEWAEFHFGNPLNAAGATDWRLSTLGLKAGDSFSIVSEVPEPANLLLMLSGVLLLAFTRRLRAQR